MELTPLQLNRQIRDAMGRTDCPNCGKDVARLATFGLAHHKCTHPVMPDPMRLFTDALRNAELAYGSTPDATGEIRWQRYATDAEIRQHHNVR